MSLRRFLAGPVSFGLNAGLAVVAGSLLSWDPGALSVWTLGLWGAGLAATAVTLKFGWPVVHASAAGLLAAAAATATGTAIWPLPLAGALAAMGAARLARVRLASRWLSRAVGLGAAGLLAYGIYAFAAGSLDLGGDGTQALEALAGAAALAVLALLGLWHGGQDEE